MIRTDITPNATLLTELSPKDPNNAFALADIGLGSPELDYVDLRELATVRGKLALPIERDLYFRPKRTITAYAQNACLRGRLIA